MLNPTTQKAVNIIKEVLIGNEVSEHRNEDLKNIYNYETSVSNEIDDILEVFGLDIFEGYSGELFISPRVDNTIFGYKNEELRNLLKLDSNLDLYMCYFIMYCLLTMFYKDSSGRAMRDYVSSKDVLKEVGSRIKILRDSIEDDKMAVSELENKEGVLAMINLWEMGLREVKLDSKANSQDEDFKSKSQNGYVNRVLKFFQNQDLMSCDLHTFKYRPQDRFKTIVSNAYDNSTYDYVEFLNRKLFKEEEV